MRADPALALKEKQREKARAAEREAERAARNEAKVRRRSRREAADESAVWTQVDQMFSLVQERARREQAQPAWLATTVREEPLDGSGRADAYKPAAVLTEADVIGAGSMEMEMQVDGAAQMDEGERREVGEAPERAAVDVPMEPMEPRLDFPPPPGAEAEVQAEAEAERTDEVTDERAAAAELAMEAAAAQAAMRAAAEAAGAPAEVEEAEAAGVAAVAAESESGGRSSHSLGAPRHSSPPQPAADHHIHSRLRSAQRPAQQSAQRAGLAVIPSSAAQPRGLLSSGPLSSSAKARVQGPNEPRGLASSRSSLLSPLPHTAFEDIALGDSALGGGDRPNDDATPPPFTDPPEPAAPGATAAASVGRMTRRQGVPQPASTQPASTLGGHGGGRTNRPADKAAIQPTPEPMQPTPEPMQPTPELMQPTPELMQPTPDDSGACQVASQVASQMAAQMASQMASQIAGAALPSPSGMAFGSGALALGSSAIGLVERIFDPATGRCEFGIHRDECELGEYAEEIVGRRVKIYWAGDEVVLCTYGHARLARTLRDCAHAPRRSLSRALHTKS